MIQCIFCVTMYRYYIIWYASAVWQWMNKLPEFISLSVESILAVGKYNLNCKHIRTTYLKEKFATFSNFLWSCVIADKCKTHEENLDSARRRIIEYEEHQRLHETERRKLHNTIQELKVLCCLRIIDDNVKRPNHEFEFFKNCMLQSMCTLTCHSDIKC